MLGWQLERIVIVGGIYCYTFQKFELGIRASPGYPMPRVTITVPEKSPQPYRFDLHREIVTVGRAQDNDIVVGCGSVSGKHSEMHRVKGGYHLIDVGSTNGIKIDGIRHQTVVLHTGMTVKLGDVEFGFSLSEDELAALASETEPAPKIEVQEEKEEEIGKMPISHDEDEDDEDDDGPDKLPELPQTRLGKAKEKQVEKPEKQIKAERSEREEEPKREEKPKKQKRSKREEDPEEDQQPRNFSKRDEYSESKAVTIGSGFILFTLIAVAGAFFYGAHTRHEKDTGEGLLKGIVNKEDAKADAPTEVEDKADGAAE